jgi:hypothetical protein
MRLYAFGWYGHGNIGDETYRTVFPLAFPGHKFTFAGEFDPVEAAAHDAVLLGGGNVLHSWYTDRLRCLNKPVYAVSVGWHDTDSLVGLPFRYVWGRDLETVEAARTDGLEASLLPDLGFLIEGHSGMGRDWIEEAFDADGSRLRPRVVVAALSCYFSYRPEFASIVKPLAGVLDDLDASVLFVPFGSKMPGDDRPCNAWVASHCRRARKNALRWTPMRPRQAADAIAAADCVLSTRYHATLFALSHGVPVVDLTHHTKNARLMGLAGCPEWSMPVERFDPSRLLYMLHAALNKPRCDRPHSLRILLEERLPTVNAAIQESVK